MPCRSGLQTRVGYQRWCIPLGLHGDGVAISNIRGAGSKVAETLSWTSLLSTAPTRFSSYLIYFCFAHVAKKSGLATTWSSFWRKLAQSFRILFSGFWPESNLEGEPEPRAGTPLAGGYYCVLYVNRGDLEWMSGHLNWPTPLPSFHVASVRPPLWVEGRIGFHGPMSTTGHLGDQLAGVMRPYPGTNGKRGAWSGGLLWMALFGLPSGRMLGNTWKFEVLRFFGGVLWCCHGNMVCVFGGLGVLELGLLSNWSPCGGMFCWLWKTHFEGMGGVCVCVP